MNPWLKSLDCTGCGVCAAVCPQGCITMEEDQEGFAHPVIHQTQCTQCGLCAATCPVEKPQGLPLQAPRSYVAWNRQASIRRESASGGIFSLIATHILEQGGVVFGAVFDERFQVVHQKATTMAQVAQMRASKYVQSAVGSCYQQAKACLEAGTPVLFTGTPCQIAALHSYLGKEYPHLYTQDLICRGVPSPKVWRMYLDARREGRDIQSVNFRDKTTGWRGISLSIGFADGTQYRKSVHEDAFCQAFLRNLCLRPACHHCAYRTLHRPVDFTLADAWGVERFAPDYDDNQGTSLVLIHSNKGQALWTALQSQCMSREVQVAHWRKDNPVCTTPIYVHPKRDAFMTQVTTLPFDQALANCYHAPLHTRIIGRIQRTLAKL